MEKYFFGFDIEEGKLTTNRQELDMLEYIARLSLDENTAAPYHMIKTIMVYHNKEITKTEAIRLAHTKKYIEMYCKALSRKKATKLQELELIDESPTEPKITPTVATEPQGATITSRNMYLPPETLEFAPTVDLQSEPWVGIKEVAERLNATIDMVLIWIRNCDLPAEKMGGVWYFKLSRVASWWNSIPKVISYNKLFKLLIDKDINKKEFVRISGMSSSTLWRLKNDGGPVKMEVIQKICDTLNCQPNDVCAFVPKDY